MVAIESEDANLPWVEKYRPTSLDELISHTDIIATLSKLVQEDRLPHLLFYGPPGTGKTSTMIAAARTMYGVRDYRSMVLELNASDERGIGVVRDQIISFAQTRTLSFNRASPSRAKLIILDEADAMTRDAQNALRRIVEKFTDNVRFCLICNYLSRVIPAIQSRCTRFRFAPLTQEQMRPRVQAIAQAENVKLTEDGERALLALAQGDMRRVINILQSTSMAFAEVNERNVHLCVGQATPGEINRCLTTLLNDSFGQAFESVTLPLQSQVFLQRPPGGEYYQPASHAYYPSQQQSPVAGRSYDPSMAPIAPAQMQTTAGFASAAQQPMQPSQQPQQFYREDMRNYTAPVYGPGDAAQAPRSSGYNTSQQPARVVLDEAGEREQRSRGDPARFAHIASPYPIEVLSALHTYSVGELAQIGRELIAELIYRTFLLMQTLKASGERRPLHAMPSGSPETLIAYCELLMRKLLEVRLRIEMGSEHLPAMDEDEFLQAMAADQGGKEEMKIDGEENELQKKFDENRRRIIALSSQAKMLEWKAIVCDPRLLKKPDKL